MVAIWTVLLLGWVAAILLVGARLSRLQALLEQKAQLRSDQTGEDKPERQGYPNTTAANARKAMDIVDKLRSGEVESIVIRKNEMYGELPQELKDKIREQAEATLPYDPKAAERELVEHSVYAGDSIEELKPAPAEGVWCLATIDGLLYWVPTASV